MQEQFVLTDSSGAEIEVRCQVRDISGILDYSLRGQNIDGDMTFFPSWYTRTDSSPQNFVIASGRRDSSNVRYALGSPTSINIHGLNLQFRHVGSRAEHDHPRARPWYTPDLYHVDSFRWDYPPKAVADYTGTIIRELIEISLRRDDADELRRLADLAAAAERHDHELARVDDKRFYIELLTQDLKKSEQRAAWFATQAAEHKALHDANLAQKEHKHRAANPRLADPAPTATRQTPVQPKTTRRNPKR